MKYKVKICGGLGEKAWSTEIITEDLDELRKKVKEENAMIIDIQKKEVETVFIVTIEARHYNDFLYVCKTKEKAEKLKEDYYKENDRERKLDIVIYEELLN
jgi:hypothetical protein